MLRKSVAALALITADIGLRLLPFRALLRFADCIGSIVKPSPSISDVAVAEARLRFSKPSCLRRCLALRMTGDRSPLVIGVRKAAGGTLEAHAWLDQAEPTPTDFAVVAML